jgi:hypothetical protein
VLTGVIGLLGGCGAIYALASVARGRGKKLEEILVAKWGGMPTTIALRHRDKFLDGVSKQRYHTAITAKLGIAMPTAEEESASPDKADDIYVGATKRLRELTRSNKQLLLKENIAYGFHRNMLAMKPVGIVSCLLGIVYGLLIAKILQVVPPHFDPRAPCRSGACRRLDTAHFAGATCRLAAVFRSGRGQTDGVRLCRTLV